MTFYGLPFYAVGAATVPAPAVPTNTTSPDVTGLKSLGVTASPDNTLDTSADRGDYYFNTDEDGDQQIIVSPGRPRGSQRASGPTARRATCAPTPDCLLTSSGS